MNFISPSAQSTREWAAKLAKKMNGGEVIGLLGDLGAGKTVFSQGIAQGLGVTSIVNSPTFVLMKVYPVSGHATIKKFVHVDTYRLSAPDDLLAIGLQDYLGQPDTVVVIEWADKIKKILPAQTQYLTVKHLEENKRAWQSAT